MKDSATDIKNDVKMPTIEMKTKASKDVNESNSSK